MPECGTQCVLCDLPIRFDTYEGCSHACEYCFAKRKKGIEEIKVHETVNSLENFVKGMRTQETAWADWEIPIHWGGMSDPFQPIEKTMGESLKALKMLAETQYPFVVSTKGRLIAENPYFELIKKCNCVVQISAVCSKYDEKEKGAPPYSERIQIAKKIASAGKRVIIRIQPFIPNVLDDVCNNMQRLHEAGVYGITVEGMKFPSKRQGMVKIGGDFVYPVETLRNCFKRIKAEAHKNGLKFFCAENRLRSMGDSLTCCGVEGLEGFTPNHFNLSHIINGDRREPSPGQMVRGRAKCFGTIDQTKSGNDLVMEASFAEMLKYYVRKKRKYILDILTPRQ